MNDIVEACMSCGRRKERKVAYWFPLSESVLKFNVDGASRAKPGRVGIRGVLRNYKGEVLLMFSKNVGV